MNICDPIDLYLDWKSWRSETDITDLEELLSEIVIS